MGDSLPTASPVDVVADGLWPVTPSRSRVHSSVVSAAAAVGLRLHFDSDEEEDDGTRRGRAHTREETTTTTTTREVSFADVDLLDRADDDRRPSQSRRQPLRVRRTSEHDDDTPTPAAVASSPSDTVSPTTAAAPIALSDVAIEIAKPRRQILHVTTSTPTAAMRRPSDTKMQSAHTATPSVVHPYELYLDHQSPLLHPLPSPLPALPVALPSSSLGGLHSSLCSRRLDSSLAHGFMFLFLDRTIDEGENFLLYSYPSSSSTARRILAMRGVLSVLEGAVAGVTGQRARIGVLEELTYALENSQEPARPGDVHGLRVKACTRELGDIGRGIAFVCLTWSPHITDEMLFTLSRNIISSLRATVGPIHHALFKPWLLTEPTRRKKAPFALKAFWKHTPTLTEAEDATKTSSTQTELAAATAPSSDLHPPVRACDVLRATIASGASWALTPISPMAPPSLAHVAPHARLPSDMEWIAEVAQQHRDRLADPDVNFTDLRAQVTTPEAAPDTSNSPPFTHAVEQPIHSSANSSPILDATPADDSTPLESPGSGSSSSSSPLLCCSFESMHVFDAFFRQTARTICRDILHSAAPSSPVAHAVPASPRLSPSLTPFSTGSACSSISASEQRLPSSSSLASTLANCSFLSPDLVPARPGPGIDAASPTAARAANPTATTVDRTIAEEISRLMRDAQSTATHATPNGNVPSTSGDDGSPPLGVLGAVLFHRGRLVHVAHPAPTGISDASSTSLPLRNSDVHEISNVLTLMGLFAPASSDSPRGSIASAAASPDALAGLIHASTHQVWFPYAAHELSESESGHLQLAPPAVVVPPARPRGNSGSNTRHMRGATLMAGWSPQLANSDSSASGRTPATGATSHSSTHTRTRSISGTNLAAMRLESPETPNPPVNNEGAADAPTPTPFTDDRIYLPRTLTIAQMGESGPSADGESAAGGDLILVLVLTAPTPRDAESLRTSALRAASTPPPLGLSTPLQQSSVVVTVPQQDGSFLHTPLPSPRQRQQYAFWFACDHFHTSRVYSTLASLYHDHSAHTRLDQQSHVADHAIGAVTSPRSVLERIVESVATPAPRASTGAPLRDMSSLHVHVGGGGVDLSVRAPSSPPTLHMRSKSTASVLSPHRQSHGASAHMNWPTSTSPPITQTNGSPACLYEYTVLDYGRGVVIRPGTDSETPHSSTPATFTADYLSLCARIHNIFGKFQRLFLNTPNVVAGAAQPSTPHHARAISFSTSLAPLLSGGLGPLAPGLDRHASREEMGKGNQLHFRRHKTMETIRHVHECGFRLSYASGVNYWVRGRLLANGSEIYVCADDALPTDLFEATLLRMAAQ